MIAKTFPALLFLLAAASAFAAGDLRLMHEGVERSYDLHVPASYQAGSLVPLLVALHGRSGSAARMEELTDFNLRADQYGFMVVYPETMRATWNYLHGISGYQPRPNDSEFLLGLVETLAGEYSIDTDRVYVAGISNGGYMAQRLACYAPERFAGFASVAAGGYGAMALDCKEYSPVNILYIHGTEDALVPWQGLQIENANGNQELVAMSITDSLKFWSRRNHCGQDVLRQQLPQGGDSPGTSVQFLTARECRADAEVSLYAVIGGGHNWPGNRSVIPPDVAGAVNMDIHASDVILSFFRGKQPATE